MDSGGKMVVDESKFWISGNRTVLVLMQRVVPNGTLYATRVRSKCSRFSLCKSHKSVLDSNRHYRWPSTTAILFFKHALRSAASIGGELPPRDVALAAIGMADLCPKGTEKGIQKN